MSSRKREEVCLCWLLSTTIAEQRRKQRSNFTFICGSFDPWMFEHKEVIRLLITTLISWSRVRRLGIHTFKKLDAANVYMSCLKTYNYQHRIHSCRSDHNQTPDSAWKWCCVVFAVVLYEINIGAYAANLLCFYWLTEPEVEQKIVCQTLLEIAPKQEKTWLLLVQASTGVNTRFCQHTHNKKTTGHQVLRDWETTGRLNRGTNLTFPAAAATRLFD